MTPEEFQSNLTVRPEVIGTTAVLIHFLPNTSSQRGTMVNNMSQQIEVIDGCETSRVQTGFEPKYAKYEFDAAERDQNVQVQKVIPKFGLSTINDKIRHNPSYTVIYSGEEDGKIGYFMINDWTQLHSGFGYRNKKVFRSYPSEGDYIPKEMKFTTAPDHDGSMYNLGLNANVCYMPMWETTEDAFVISESLAKRFTHTVIDKRVVNINPDVCPLNLYGDELNYRSFPDIGDTVRDDGILIALRRHDPNSFLMDMSDAELSVPRHLHDDLIMAPPGAQVVDVQVFINHRMVKTCVQSCYNQLMEYQQLHYNYYNSIIQAYDELAAQGYEFRPEFVTLVTRCKCFTYSGVGKLMVLMDKKDRIENIRLEVTYAYSQKIAQGYKITGLDGSELITSVNQ